MHPISLARPLCRCASIGLMLALGFGQAGAQCDITGPATLCGGSAELCGPTGPYFYDWRDPSGNAIGDQRCLSVTAPGTYHLSTFDFINGLAAGPCEHVVSPGSVDPPSCAIEGPTTACANTLAQLCAPEGADEYQWNGPEEFTAATRCIDVNVDGVYRLRAWSATTGCWSVTCERTVSFGSCDAPKNCPMTPAELTRSCGNRRSSRGLFDSSQMNALARNVDERSAAFSWKDPAAGLCRTLGDCYGLRDRARRQFAGVLANVSAQQLGLVPRFGSARGLDPATSLQIDGASTTIAEWLAQTDEQLGSLERRSLRERRTKETYRSIIRVGWKINHGLGMGPVCVPDRRVATRIEGDVEGGEATAQELSLEAELRDSEEAFTLESMEPNPMAASTRITYVLSTSASSNEVLIGVYDVTGRLVRVLDRGARAPGRYEAVWDGRDTNGSPMRNGAYFVMGRVAEQRITARLILVR